MVSLIYVIIILSTQYIIQLNTKNRIIDDAPTVDNIFNTKNYTTSAIPLQLPIPDHIVLVKNIKNIMTTVCSSYYFTLTYTMIIVLKIDLYSDQLSGSKAKFKLPTLVNHFGIQPVTNVIELQEHRSAPHLNVHYATLWKQKRYTGTTHSPDILLTLNKINKPAHLSQAKNSSKYIRLQWIIICDYFRR